MIKAAVALIGAVLLTLWSLGSFQQGVRDLTKSMTTWKYYEYRDMRRTVAISPQKRIAMSPDSLTVPVTGWGDRVDVTALELDRISVSAALLNPVRSDSLSVANGDSVYRKVCVPCHGSDMRGDGKVAKSFLPPPDLLGEAARSRTDGYLYGYIRHGGPVMPRYGHMVTADEAWDVVNYIRERQRTNPR